VMPGLRYLDAPTVAAMFVLGPDMAAVETEINRLDNQALVRYYKRAGFTVTGRITLSHVRGGWEGAVLTRRF